MSSKINELPNFAYTPPPPCPAIDVARYKRQETIEHAMYMGGAGQEHFNLTMNGLYRLIAYRAEVAKQLKRAGSEIECKALDELFDFCNNQIKEYLAIP